VSRLIELARPGCDCGHCRHLPQQAPSRGGCRILTAAILGNERHERRFWIEDPQFVWPGSNSYSIGFNAP